jgi:hypothetical protein
VVDASASGELAPSTGEGERIGFGRRTILAVAAAAIQLAGCLAIVLHAARHTGPWAALAGFYLSSLLGLACGEAAVGASSGPRKRWIALLTTAGLLGSYVWIDSSRRTGSSSATFVVLLPACGIVVSMLGAWLLGARRSAAALASARRSRGVRSAAGLVAASAAAFVVWHAVVTLVTPDYVLQPRLIGDLRTLVSAEAAYETVNSGFDDTPECLQAPTRCLPTYPPSGPVFLRTGPWTGTVGYFRRRFVPGAPVPPGDRPAGASSSSVRSYAYVAVPAPPDGFQGFVWRRAGISLEGVPSFCADSTGRICRVDGGGEPRVVDGLCAPDPECQDLR